MHVVVLTPQLPPLHGGVGPSSANTIRHTQIAEARISYGGRGDISRVQKTPAGQSLVEKFSPF